ncbi:MAG: carbon-nitrogen hydrolase family protein [Deltaproteobacteria bacterium]|nr:carbon-nitrogen hydrolase family protein [Deltaproteobacteria bacterium]
MKNATTAVLQLVVAVALAAGCAPAPVEAGLEAPTALTAAFGRDEGRGNLLGVQVWLTPRDYADRARLRARIDGWLDEAHRQGLVNQRTVVVFPEYAGAWLVAEGEGPDVVDAPTIGDAMTAMALAHLPEFAGARLSAPADDADAYAAFAIKAERMAAAITEVFGSLARDHGVTVVSGSALLPTPEVVDGAIAVTPGAPLQNVVFVFGPDGAPYPDVVRKAFPIESELPFVEPADPAALPVFDTPAGRLGVLICADSWYPASYREMEAKGAEVLAVPVFATGEWRGPWKGYNGADEPSDVDLADIDALTEDQAWMKYSAPGRAPRAELFKALTVTLRGRYWDLHAEGQPLVVNGPARERAPEVDAPLLTSLWL